MHIIRTAGFGVTVATAMVFSSPTSAANSINGQWVTQDKDAIVRIGKCGATICGRIHKFLIPPPNGVNQKDINNPNKKLRNRKLLGTAILTGFKPDGNKWRGRIYDPKSGKTYRSVIRRESASQLKVEGCIGPFCQGQKWRKVQ